MDYVKYNCIIASDSTHERITEGHGYKPSPGTTIGLSWGWETELGEEVLKGGDGSALAAVILVAVHVKHLLPRHRQHARDDTFLGRLNHT